MLIELNFKKVQIKTDFTKEHGTENLDIGCHVTLDVRYTKGLKNCMNPFKFQLAIDI